MATEKQINANRQNGKKGGPKTPPGRAAVRNNALKHGLSAQHPVIPGFEDHGVFDKYLDQLRLELQPVGIIEHTLVNQMADSYWRRQRIMQMESGMFLRNKQALEGYQPTRIKFEDALKEDNLHQMTSNDTLALYYRYDAMFERSFHRAWKELKSLQAARRPEPEPEAVATQEPQPVVVDFAEQTQSEPAPVASNAGPDTKPREKRDPQAENDDRTM